MMTQELLVEIENNLKYADFRRELEILLLAHYIRQLFYNFNQLMLAAMLPEVKR